MVFYVLVTMESDDSKHIGAKFIEECSYIDCFLHED